MSKLNKAEMTVVIAIILLTTSAMFMAIPVQPAEAQRADVQPYVGPLHPGDTPNATEWDGTTYAALSFSPPNVIGVGQSLLVNMWITPAGPSNNVYIPEGGFVITILKPDGTQDVFRIRSEPATFANWFLYVPDQVGTYSLKFEFLGAFFPAGRYYDGYITTNTSLGAVYSVSDYFKPSSTGWQNLTVQQDFVLSWPLTLPTDLWTRPASMNNRGWWPILGAYPGTGYNGHRDPNWDTNYPGCNPTWNSAMQFHPYVGAPNTAHMLRYRLDAVAGLTGGPAQQYGLTSSASLPDVIYAGRIYDTRTLSINGIPTSCAFCSDLRTGEVYYAIPTSQGGVTPNLVTYLWPQASGAGTVASEELGSSTVSVELLSLSGSTLRKINPTTGAVSNYSIAPLSGGTLMNQDGGFFVTIQNLGNSVPEAERYRLINWTSRGSLANLTTSTGTRIISNTTYQRSSLPTYMDWESDLGATNPSTRVHGPFADERWFARVEFYRLSTGALLYNISTTEYPDVMYHPSPTMMDHGKVAVWTQGGYYVIFDGSTGKWFRTEGTDYPWSSAGGFGAYAIASAYGMVFRFAYNYVYAFNWTDGKMVWKYEAPAYAPFESPYNDGNGTSVYSFNQGCVIADGKMYIANTEHTPTYPLTRGWGIHCINITTGEGLWKLDNPMSPGGMEDGYMCFNNAWDGTMYVIGKGPSKTTVTAPDVNVPLGTGFTIKGTVLDLSPAQPDTPCVSKDSMSQQMEYLHLGQPIGGIWNNVTILGVPVFLTAFDENGNPTDLGTATTDGYYGTFEKAWTPPAEGTYKIIATFAGDDSYGSSGAATAVTVGPAIEYPEPIAPETPADYSMLLYGILVAVIIAIVLAVIALFWKR